MPMVHLKQCMEKDEHGQYSAVIKMGTYGSPQLAEDMGKAMMMILTDAMNGMNYSAQLPREIRKD